MAPVVDSGMIFGDFADAYVDRGFGDERLGGIALDLSALDPAHFTIGGYFTVQCFGPDGELKWSEHAKNGVTNAGIASVLGIYLQAQTQVTTWYLGLVDNAGFTAFAAADTMASHSGWSEVATANITAPSRAAWSPGAPSGGSIVNPSPTSFAMIPSSTLTVKGCFLVSDNTAGGTAGTLFATAAFSGGTQSCNSGDTIRVTYTVGATSSS